MARTEAEQKRYEDLVHRIESFFRLEDPKCIISDGPSGSEIVWLTGASNVLRITIDAGNKVTIRTKSEVKSDKDGINSAVIGGAEGKAIADYYRERDVASYHIAETRKRDAIKTLKALGWWEEYAGV